MDEKDLIDRYLKGQITKAVESWDFETRQIKYSDEIGSARNITAISGPEEIARAYFLARLVNEKKYKLKNIEIEKEYDIGRPKVNKPRIDLIVHDDNSDDCFLYVELKSPSEFSKNQDEVIEKQLYNLASQEKGIGNRVKYLALCSYEVVGSDIYDRCIIIDYEKYPSFDEWKEARDFSDSIPENYDKAEKEPYIKNGSKDLNTDFSRQDITSLQKNLHNVLWGGGGTDDNEVFTSLVNIILAKIQDETEKVYGQKYDLQILGNADGTGDTPEDLFNRANELYRRALKEKMNVTDDEKLEKEFIINPNKFSLNKLKYAVSQLEGYGFVGGKDSMGGKDILGDFFEGIIRTGFKQTKGQFFTPLEIVVFILWGLQIDKLAIRTINEEHRLPYVIDPSAGSGTFLIEYMRFITQSIKYRFKEKLGSSTMISDKYEDWFLPDNRENKWAQEYIYGIEHNFNLGTATKVNMILHGDGSTNIEVKDGLLSFNNYHGRLADSKVAANYFNKGVNGNFDLVISNPPFSVDLDEDTKRNIKQNFVFGERKNSENLFIERYYQLLKEGGRLGVVLPESVFDTIENKYIRLFLYKYFNIKAVVSLPQITFQPFTGTKTSLLFAQKKTRVQVKQWDDLWQKYEKEWQNIRTRVQNILDVYLIGKDRSKLPSIRDMAEDKEKELLIRILKNVMEEKDKILDVEEIIKKYKQDIDAMCKEDRDTVGVFGHCNTWWVFGEVVKELNYQILMAEVEHVGYKRTKTSIKVQPNELFRRGDDGQVIVDDGSETTALDYLRNIIWD